MFSEGGEGAADEGCPGIDPAGGVPVGMLLIVRVSCGEMSGLSY